MSGTGIGLVATRRLVELMNGTISVTSQSSLGTTFTIELPIATAQAATPRSPPTAPKARSYGPKTVLF